MEKNQEEKQNMFYRKDGGKSKSHAIETPSISLTKGGGAIKGIDETFTVNTVNATASVSFPIPFSKSRELTPNHLLSYNSGSGNGIFGIGWNLSIPSIKIRTDRKWPKYINDIHNEESDTYLFSEAEDLVPELKKKNGKWLLADEIKKVFSGKEPKTFIITSYRPRIEGLFAKIERWWDKENNEIRWRVINKENVTTLFGWSENSRISDPADKSKIFQWLPEYVYDDKGNCIHYLYKEENDEKFDKALIYNKNRVDQNGEITYTNRYISEIHYGNRTPFQLDFGENATLKNFPAESDFVFKTIFDYGEYDKDKPLYKGVKSWNFREDPFSEYIAGFEIRTTRLCHRILLFHNFPEKESLGENVLVKSVDLTYSSNPTDEKKVEFTFLEKITVSGYIKNSNEYSKKSFPSTTFEYEKHRWNSEIKIVVEESLVHSPIGVDGKIYQFLDLDGVGIPGIFTEQAGEFWFKENLGNGKFARARLLPSRPSFSSSNKFYFTDLDADGKNQFSSYSGINKGYFELNDEAEWEHFRNFELLPNVDFNDPDGKFMDLNGDNRPEFVITREGYFLWCESEGKKGFSKLHKTMKPFDEEEGPAILFSDKTQSVHLASMSGSKGLDIVRVRNGEISYWPNLGYGKFGKKISMDNSPFFDHPDKFNPAYIRLADIGGSGTTDVVYLGGNSLKCYLNECGNRFAKENYEIICPEINWESNVVVADILGKGLSCIVWSSSLEKNRNESMKYIDLMGGVKPHIMKSYENGLGKKVSFQYTPSTQFYLDDKNAGTPWATKLHFPVHCVSRVETEDRVTGTKLVSTYRYRHGYYDHLEKEFRGFGFAERYDCETLEQWKTLDGKLKEDNLDQPPVITRQWFHTGAYLGREKILNLFSNEYWHVGKNLDFKEKELEEIIVVDREGKDITAKLSIEEMMEAIRACKGMEIRNEVLSDNEIPYSVANRNWRVELIQPRFENQYAVFSLKEREAITYSYERKGNEPRISHNLNIKLDKYGNVLESVSVAYGKIRKDTTLTKNAWEVQSKTNIICTENVLTDDFISEDIYKLRVPAETKSWELNEIKLQKDRNYFEITDFLQPSISKRLIENVRTLYWNDDFSGSNPLGKMGRRALLYEAYQLAYTPKLLQEIYEEKKSPEELKTLMEEGRFLHTLDERGKPDENWWIGSGKMLYKKENIDNQNLKKLIPEGYGKFYLPIAYMDAYGAESLALYDTDYYIYREKTVDAKLNETAVEEFDYRTLLPKKMKDINKNLSEIIFDELGMVKAMALLGKGDEADSLEEIPENTSAEEEDISNFFTFSQENICDSQGMTALGRKLLKKATVRFLYNFSTQPATVVSIAREEHYVTNSTSALQISFEYSNGFGKVIMKKIQAESGKAKHLTVDGEGKVKVEEVENPGMLRWIGNGRIIFNNKGNPVKQYEPYFSSTPRYEDSKELVEIGTATTIYYDAPGRVIKTEFSDGSFTKTDFDPWKQLIYDQNDTVCLPIDEINFEESRWYRERKNGQRGDEEKKAADKTFGHRNTPNIQYFDSLGRPFFSVEDNGNDQLFKTFAEIDIEGNLLSISDARENVVMKYKYDMLGNGVYQESMDAGKRWLLKNSIDNPLRTWDERGHEFQYYYDELHRPLFSRVVDGALFLDNVYDKIVYGEDIANDTANNLRGKVYMHYDTAGVVETPAYDFKGVPIESTRQIFSKYKDVVNWEELSMATQLLEEEKYTSKKEVDALGRVTRETAPDGSVIRFFYNERGLLKGEDVEDKGGIKNYILQIEYNEKNQRKKISYLNGVKTSYEYEENTFRLKRLLTEKAGKCLQDLSYTYDPVGNIIHIKDGAYDNEFFSNKIVEPVNEYTYDPLYRLIEATGRENDTAHDYSSGENWSDKDFIKDVVPNTDKIQTRKYTQNYQYDSVGNITQMSHKKNSGEVQWIRNYVYESTNNRLKSTEIGKNFFEYRYHEKHGFITEMPHLPKMSWNFKEELVVTSRQKQKIGTGESTYYQYDGNGQRVRKITEKSSTDPKSISKKDERIYLGLYETYRTYGDDNLVEFERETLSLMNEDLRFLMIEKVKTNEKLINFNEKKGTVLVRYQYHNHIGSASLELDEEGKVITYEEYHPFGTTAYQAINSEIKATAKRYRYTGMERDDETGLSYHNARYYIPWLGRWLSTDKSYLEDGLNLYLFTKNNPILYKDISGNESWKANLSFGEKAALWLDEKVGMENIQKAGNVSAGVGDNLTHDGTKLLRKFLGTDGFVDGDSLEYKIGNYSTTVVKVSMSGGTNSKDLSNIKNIVKDLSEFKKFIKKEVYPKVIKIAEEVGEQVLDEKVSEGIVKLYPKELQDDIETILSVRKLLKDDKDKYPKEIQEDLEKGLKIADGILLFTLLVIGKLIEKQPEKQLEKNFEENKKNTIEKRLQSTVGEQCTMRNSKTVENINLINP